MDMKRFFLYFIVIAALALAGCGGNGGRTTMMPDPDPEPPAPMTHDIDLGMLLTGYTTVPAGTYEIDAGESMDVGHATFMCPAGGVDCSVTVAADGTATSTGGAATATASQAAMDAKDEADMAAADAAAAARAMANAVIDGIVNPTTAGDPTTARGTDATNRPGQADGTSDDFLVTPGDTTSNTAGKAYIGRAPADGSTSAGDDLGMDDPNDMYDFAMMEGSATTLGVFDGSVHTRTTRDGKKDTIHLYTDVDDLGALAYNTYYPVSTSFNDTGQSVRPGVASRDATTALTLQENTQIKASLLSGSGFPTTPGMFITTQDDTDTTNDEGKFSGMFNGIAGNFECTSASCDARLNDKEMISLTGTWTFTPSVIDVTNLMVPGVDHDTNYLAFGYWMQEMTVDGKKTYEVGTIYDGSEDYTGQSTTTDASAALLALRGSASYSGKAAGMYGIKTFNSDGTTATARAGDFTADAELTANFGGTSIAVKEQYTISGSVKNFMDGGNRIANWTLALQPITFGERSASDDTVSSQTVTFRGGSTTGDGNWRGSFYGNPADRPSDNTDARRDYPTGVAGDFTGHFLNGHVIGAFGARKQ